jgi:hypothetical protein
VTYRDVFVRRGPLADAATERDDPVVVVEVLPPSTRGEDLVRKRHGYQAIPALRHLLHVYPDRPEVGLASREPDGSWRSVFHQGMDAALALPALEAEVRLASLYEGVSTSREAGRVARQLSS